jgi:hypothetical protein
MVGIIVLEGLPSLPFAVFLPFSLAYIKLSKALVSGKSYDVVTHTNIHMNQML